jgi:hypothetical protein
MTTKHTPVQIPKQLRAVSYYTDCTSILDEGDFQVVDVPSTAVLLDYESKLGISHWSDSKKASIEFTPKQQNEFARRLVACWNACEGLHTESLERGKPLAAQIVDALNDAEDAKRQRNELLKFAQLVLRGLESGAVRAKSIIDMDPEAERLDMRPLVDIARHAIAKGGAA